MNTEELEKSLRAEFEGYMKNVMAEMRRDVSDLQGKFEGEFDKHRSQMDEAFRSLSSRFEAAVEFDPAFSESVTEHLRLARDEGALVTAKALGEAEKLGNDESGQDFQNLRKGINEIKNNATQATILRALVDAAANFAPRGAFFILKNDHLVGWKVFGSGDIVDEDTVRSVHFPVSADTVLSNSINSLSVKGAGSADRDDNARFLDPLHFGYPERMFAVPLSARGRGVAVLYVDGGETNERVNLDALETLVSVAGLTVELLASGVAPAPAAESYSPAEVPQSETQPESEPESHVESPAVETFEASSEPAASFSAPAVETFDAPTDVASFESPAAEPAETTPTFESEPEYVGEVEVSPEVEDLSPETEAPVVYEPSYSKEAIGEPVVADEPVVESSFSEPEAPATDFAFTQSDSFEESAQTAVDESSNGYEVERHQEAEVEPEAVYEIPAASVDAPKPRTRERNVDLPIEVSEDERRSHSDARRFARLLVSEIRLYNEQRLAEGRESGDIYELLKEAIDRSREMYDKRVLPEVASKFDYFHYELVNNLAEGNEEKLGAGYLAVKA